MPKAKGGAAARGKRALVQMGGAGASGKTTRRETEKAKVLAVLEPHLRYLAENVGNEAISFTVEGVAKAIGKSRQTLYSHGLVERIETLRAQHEAAVQRVRRARPGAQQKIARLTAERDAWEAKYAALLDVHTRLMEALRNHPKLDWLHLLAQLEVPLPKVDRSEPAKQTTGRSHLRAVK